MLETLAGIGCFVLGGVVGWLLRWKTTPHVALVHMAGKDGKGGKPVIETAVFPAPKSSGRTGVRHLTPEAEMEMEKRIDSERGE